MPATDMASYMREYRAKNPEWQKTQERQRRQKARALLTTLKNTPCTDCGVEYPYYVMQFDHLRDKRFNLSDRLTSIPQLIEEAQKCEVVCANCHAERTHQRKHSIVA